MDHEANTRTPPTVPDPRTMVAKFRPLVVWTLVVFHFICLVSSMSCSLLFVSCVLCLLSRVLGFLGYCTLVFTRHVELNTLRHSSFHFGLFLTLLAIVSRTHNVESCSATHYHSPVCLIVCLYHVHYALPCNAAFPRHRHADLYDLHLRWTFSLSPATLSCP